MSIVPRRNREDLKLTSIPSSVELLVTTMEVSSVVGKSIFGKMRHGSEMCAHMADRDSPSAVVNFECFIITAALDIL